MFYNKSYAGLSCTYISKIHVHLALAYQIVKTSIVALSNEMLKRF